MEWEKRNTLKRSGHVERMGSAEFVKKVYESELEGPNRKGRPLGRWKDRVEEDLGDRGINVRECLNRQGGSVGIGRGGDSYTMVTHWGDIPEGSEVSGL